ncbi:hypothetical protein ACFCXT_23440 [Streptomyces vinaceus]
MAFNQKAGTSALLVPHLVAEQLLARASHDMTLLKQWDHESRTRA